MTAIASCLRSIVLAPLAIHLFVSQLFSCPETAISLGLSLWVHSAHARASGAHLIDFLLKHFWKAVKNCGSPPLGDLNCLLGSVKWNLMARSGFLFIPVGRIWKHFCIALHIWLIVFTLTANYSWWKGKVEFRKMGALFMNFHSENVGCLFCYLMPPFTHGPAKVRFLVFYEEWVMKLTITARGLTDSQPRKDIQGHSVWPFTHCRNGHHSVHDFPSDWSPPYSRQLLGRTFFLIQLTLEECRG